MRIIILSLICSAVIGLIVAVFLRFKKYFDRKYEEFEDERYRAASGPSGREAEKLRSGQAAEPDKPKQGGS